MLAWQLLTPGALDLLGYIPTFLYEDDPRPAAGQFNERYAHGGGWRPMNKWEFSGGQIKYPGDPPYEPVARGQLRHETIYVYHHSWVCIVQPDGSFQVARMD